MKAERKIWSISIHGIGIAVVINNFWSIPVLGATLGPIQFPVLINNTQVGQVKVQVDDQDDPYFDALVGEFEATSQIRDLENQYKVRFNWFQIVTQDSDPKSDSNGNLLTPPYIDPPRNGYDDIWADDRPWYLEEFSKPPNDPRFWNPGGLLDNNVFGSRLSFEDSPGNYIGEETDFATFLIASDPQNKIYDFLGGFEWSSRGVQQGEEGAAKIVRLENNAIFKQSYKQQIWDEFGYRWQPLFRPYGYYTDRLGGALGGQFCGGLGGVFDNVLCGSIGSPPSGYTPNDDGSFGSYPLGFSFSYFGQSYDSFYINNNGNISFGRPVSAYTPNPLLTENIAPLIAPYWADVDTRGTGTVAVRTDIPNQLIVTWDKVGYYSQHTDKLASFQLVLRGSDYPVPPNEGNVGFFYKDVQWETGDASSGFGGFGGIQAGVGFSDGLSTVNPGEISLPFSQQAGISEYVGNKHFWFNYPETATCSGASGGGGCVPALARNIASQPMLVSKIAGSNAPKAKNLSGKDSEDDALAAEAVPEPTTVLGALLAACGLGTLKKLKNRKLIQP